MTETPVNPGFTFAPPAASSAPSAPSAAPVQEPPPAAPDNRRGHSPARDMREQMSAAAGERTVSVAGKDYSEREIGDLLADKAQRDIVKAGLPQDPLGYHVALPEGLKAPEGMEFQFDLADPALRQFREFALRRGMDQAAFAEGLGIFASTKVAELQTANAARERELGKLGAAAHARIDAIETWLRAKVGDKASIMAATLRAYPVARNVEAFEGIIRAFSS
jgi:hypothetical protein